MGGGDPVVSLVGRLEACTFDEGVADLVQKVSLRLHVRQTLRGVGTMRIMMHVFAFIMLMHRHVCKACKRMGMLHWACMHKKHAYTYALCVRTHASMH